MAVCCESGDANKNVSNAQRSIRVVALPYCGHFFDLSVARCGEWKDSGWIVGLTGSDLMPVEHKLNLLDGCTG
jgi:hypothetical protein